MFIAGLWHGPSYNYIFWGTIHGLGLTVNRTYLYFTKKKIRKILIPDLLGKLITLTFVSVAWVFFRANSFDDAFISLHSILFNFDIAYLLPFYDARSLFSILFIVSIILIFSPEYLKQKVQFLVSESPVYVKAVIFIIILQILIQIQTESIQPFIYYQF
jgi:D-alanyl-lipoteichoic acid acyltransferase DltB (MBOAT superfamily)